jgi:acyl CoA:acetate/3-ketoacid CoA transferase alpha subunit
LLEESITTHFSLVQAVRGDQHGNIVFAFPYGVAATGPGATPAAVSRAVAG